MLPIWLATKWPTLPGMPTASTAEVTSWLKALDPNRPALEGIGKGMHDIDRAITDASGQAALLADLALQHVQQAGGDHWDRLAAVFAGAEKLAGSFGDPKILDHFQQYLVDGLQRSVLFFDVLRERGNSYLEREREGFKPVLVFDYDLILDGRTFLRRVNYALVRIRPPEGYPEQREDERPFVIIDPRAGHGSGIGGYKSDSEVGVALRDGHPVYFVIFFSDPEPGQTLADVTAAEAAFLHEVRRRHPDSPKPLVIGNCQGGWAAMLLAATNPDATGLIVAAGAPLSYWAGVRGRNPLRYLGGLAGGALPALLVSDLTGGRFDGAHLVMNFEGLNPANNWWRKYYNVFAHVDTEAERFLEFERWWSGFYFMNEAEIRWVLENLFIGNKLTHGGAVLDDGTPVDLRRIKSPIVVFASYGDNITPPQQALNWIADLYQSTDEIEVHGQVIIYTLHESIGHLGIFVSASVARKQHREITSVTKTIEALAPGLYEMIIEVENGERRVSFEQRTIDDIRGLCRGQDDENRFVPVARLSEWAAETYDMTLRPVVQRLATPELAQALVRGHPLRQQRYLFSDRNVLMAGIGGLAATARGQRRPAEPDNPFLQLEKLNADLIEEGWELVRDVRDAWLEWTFHAIYGSPWMRVLAATHRPRRVVQDPRQFPEVQAAVERAAGGGYAEAVIRMLILMAHARGSVRRSRLERSNAILLSREPFSAMSAEERSGIIHEQTLIADYAPVEAQATLKTLLPEMADRQKAIDLILEVAGPLAEMSTPTIVMFERLQDVLDVRARGWDMAEPAVRSGPAAPGEPVPAVEAVVNKPGAVAAEFGKGESPEGGEPADGLQQQDL